MKLKTKRKSEKLLESYDTKSKDNQAENQHLNLEVDHNSSSLKKSHKIKRKARPSSQDEENILGQPKPKRKSKSKIDVDNETDCHLAVDEYKSEESDENDTEQDNTPQSLVKKKKHKKKKKEAIQVVAKPNNSTLDYLRKWKSDRSNWKFEKVKQIRLISNMFDSEKLPDDHFSIFLEYMEGGGKSVKELMSKLANEVVDEMEKWESLSDAEKETTPKVNENKYERARTVLQMLQ